MFKKQSTILAIMFIANPFVLLFYQNCSKVPTSTAQAQSQLQKAQASEKVIKATHRAPASINPFKIK